MGLRKEKLDSFRSELLSRRNVLAHELQQVTAELLKEDEIFTDAMDQAVADADKSLTLQMKNRDRGILAQIDEALRRIDAGTFGECEQCGEEISEARIKVYPSTTLCIDCKAELESEQSRYSGRH